MLARVARGLVTYGRNAPKSGSCAQKNVASFGHLARLGARVKKSSHRSPRQLPWKRQSRALCKLRFQPVVSLRSISHAITGDQKTFVSSGINDTSIEPRLRWDSVILIALPHFVRQLLPVLLRLLRPALRIVAARPSPKANHICTQHQERLARYDRPGRRLVKEKRRA